MYSESPSLGCGLFFCLFSSLTTTIHPDNLATFVIPQHIAYTKKY